MVGKGKCSEQKSHFKYKVHEFVCFVRQCIAYYSHNIIINNSILEHNLITLLFELWTIRYFNDFRNCKWTGNKNNTFTKRWVDTIYEQIIGDKMCRNNAYNRQKWHFIKF